MKKIIIINKIAFFLIFKYCLFFNLESKSTLKKKGRADAWFLTTLQIVAIFITFM